MKCPFCNSNNTSVIDSRNQDDNSIRRRRICENCNKRFTTYERIENIQILIKKKDGTRQIYDRNKIKNGIINSSIKRPISMDLIDDILNEIENEIFSNNVEEITTKMIGEIVLNKLKQVDKVAYIRFASVYRNFEEVTDFDKETKKLN